jgi:ubiquinone/menaquinone biosynthesis C-methylase UbiE
MESIEHFEHADILRYLDELKRVLKPGGILIGSSSFPATRDEAEVLCSKNPSHRYICTRAEIVDMLGSRFAECRVFHNGMFFWARK